MRISGANRTVNPPKAEHLFRCKPNSESGNAVRIQPTVLYRWVLFYAYLDNAIYHSQSKYFLKIDLKNFFPSICAEDFIELVNEWHKSTDLEWLFDQIAIDFIKKTCFDINERLPIGYPSSPLISNTVMYPFDQVVKKN